MKDVFFVLWVSQRGEPTWSGPHVTIAEACESVPTDARSFMLVRPLRAMTPGEAREALPILEGKPWLRVR